VNCQTIHTMTGEIAQRNVRRGCSRTLEPARSSTGMRTRPEEPAGTKRAAPPALNALAAALVLEGSLANRYAPIKCECAVEP
jgi:hypothetical protein